MKKSDFDHLTSGFSLLELIIAISVAGIVTTLALTAFTDIFKGFKLQNSRAERVREMIITKKKIEQIFTNISSTVSWTDYSVRYKTEGSDSVITVQYKNGSLFKDNTIICDNLKSFKFDKREHGSSRNELFFWESVLLNNGWLGGVFSTK